jgi:hypothetical protein
LILLCLGSGSIYARQVPQHTTIDFYGDSITLPYNGTKFVDFRAPLSEAGVMDFYAQMDTSHYEGLIAALRQYRETHHPDDWLYYQLIRKTAETISPKKDNYIRYTLYKWYFLLKSGFDAELAFTGDTLLFFAQCNENIYNVPSHMRNGKEYVCLNYHDYQYSTALEARPLRRIVIPGQDGRPFSYKLSKIPAFKSSDYRDKEVTFEYQGVTYRFMIRMNEQVKNFYANYPVADYKLYFNVPMSRETYNSLIPKLQEITAGMSITNGIDYLMRFTRYAIQYKPDMARFGQEKRLNPEQTLLYEEGDCEDHSALFFFLVKEIYRLPMLVLTYPMHVTVAVRLDKAPGDPIIYNGEKYYICEPTPQARDLRMGKVPKKQRAEAYEIVYAYRP